MNKTEPRAEAVPSTTDMGKPVAWREALRRLEQSDFGWLTTILPDGRPHSRPVLTLWMDDAPYIVTNADTRKGRNLAANSHASLAVSNTQLPAVDLVVEGDAVRVTDNVKLDRLAAEFRNKGWQVSVGDSALDADEGAPTAGPAPYLVYEIRPRKAFGFPGTEGADDSGGYPQGVFTPTRWRFER
jgi:general stress protein 26